MKTLILYALICLVCLTSCNKCKKNLREKVNVTGTIYKNCNELASNETYYLFAGANKKFDEVLTTDSYGNFSFKVDKGFSGSYNIMSSTNTNSLFGYIDFNGQEQNIGIIREQATNQLIIKLKTNRYLSNLDTLKYVFQYDTKINKVNGPFKRDTIIAFYIWEISPRLYNDNPTKGQVFTFWWNFNKPTVTVFDNQVDYSIRGCAPIADTAFIVIP